MLAIYSPSIIYSKILSRIFSTGFCCFYSFSNKQASLKNRYDFNCFHQETDDTWQRSKGFINRTLQTGSPWVQALSAVHTSALHPKYWPLCHLDADSLRHYSSFSLVCQSQGRILQCCSLYIIALVWLQSQSNKLNPSTPAHSRK